MSRILKKEMNLRYEERVAVDLLPCGADTWNALEPIRPTVLQTLRLTCNSIHLTRISPLDFSLLYYSNDIF